MPADLHIHTNFSDGIFAPHAVVEQALQTSLTTIAITDHDTVDGVEPAQAAAAGRIAIIPGVEVSAAHLQNDVHILGYYIDLGVAEFLHDLQQLRLVRVARIEKILAKLYNLGIKLDLSAITAENPNPTICRSHIAYAMVQAGVVKQKQAAFDRYIGFGKPAYVARENISPAQAISLVRLAKGVPVLAHPGITNFSATFIAELVAAGLQGIEVYHPNHSKKQIKFYSKLAAKHNLVMTGGSDFHGSKTEYVNKIGSLPVADQVVTQLQNLAAA